VIRGRVLRGPFAVAVLACALLAGPGSAAQSVTFSAGLGWTGRSDSGPTGSQLAPWIALSNRNFLRLDRLSADARLRLELDGPVLSAGLLPTLPFRLPGGPAAPIAVAYLGPELSYRFMTLPPESSHWQLGGVIGVQLPLDPQLQLQLEAGWRGNRWQTRLGGVFNF
jgi:hypothetical protein